MTSEHRDNPPRTNDLAAPRDRRIVHRLCQMTLETDLPAELEHITAPRLEAIQWTGLLRYWRFMTNPSMPPPMPVPRSIMEPGDPGWTRLVLEEYVEDRSEILLDLYGLTPQERIQVRDATRYTILNQGQRTDTTREQLEAYARRVILQLGGDPSGRREPAQSRDPPRRLPGGLPRLPVLPGGSGKPAGRLGAVPQRAPRGGNPARPERGGDTIGNADPGGPEGGGGNQRGENGPQGLPGGPELLENCPQAGVPLERGPGAPGRRRRDGRPHEAPGGEAATLRVNGLMERLEKPEPGLPVAVPDVLNHEDLALREAQHAGAMLLDQPDGNDTFSTCRGQWKAASAAVTRGRRGQG